jgi:hypothetical protein
VKYDLHQVYWGIKGVFMFYRDETGIVGKYNEDKTAE